MTWGRSKFDYKGVHEHAMENDRVVISGHAAEVGVVGWSMGGGHSPLGPWRGLGVDQMLEVEMVGPDGSLITTNAEGTYIRSPSMIHKFRLCQTYYMIPDGKTEFTENSDLFWAMSGGGAGTWGAVTAMTIKVHKPRDDCKEKCYQTTNAAWIGNFNTDMGEMAKVLSAKYLAWAAQASQYWSGYFIYAPVDDQGGYYVGLAELMYVGNADDEDAQDIANHFRYGSFYFR